MNRFKEFTTVRVCKLTQNADEYDGWNMNQRQPAIGDTGALLDILSAEGLPNKYVVENSDANGITIWVSEFFEEELEPED